MVAPEGKSPYFKEIQVGDILQFGPITQVYTCLKDPDMS